MLADRLRSGDRVGIISPSDPLPSLEDETFLRGLNFLSDLGLQPVLGQYVASRSLGYAAAPEEKLKDIHHFFADPTIKALFCSQGGDTANAVLADLDFDLIRNHPKILVGLSDNTVLLNAVFARTGLITFHGPEVRWGMGKYATDYDRRELVFRLMEGGIGPIPARGQRRTLRGGRAEGPLIGGNLRCLLNLAGTPFFPDFSGAVFFLESFQMTPARCDYLFRQLLQMGVFDRIVGAVIGHLTVYHREEESFPDLEDILLQVTSGYDFPVLKMEEFGHNCPNTLLPVGGRVLLDADRMALEILEPCVD